MRDFHGVIKELKMYLADGKSIKILDKDVANELGITQAQFATIKSRNSTPYTNILEFCKREDICCIELFFD